MESKEYIESGILELYVYGLLSESENDQVTAMSNKNPEIKAEILSIEKAIINLSSSFSPFISHSQFEKIKSQLELKHSKVVDIKSRGSLTAFIGWAASIVLLIGIGYQYSKINDTNDQIKTIEKQNMQLQQTVVDLDVQNKETEKVLNVVRDETNTIVALAGQTVAPTAKAKIYWNKQTQVVYVDASGLPTPPEGKEYQIWSLKLAPQLTPTSIGMLANFNDNRSKIFAVEKTGDAEAFGITLEPKGGSPTPTMEQLYTLGKV
ncbi:anti-sigma factor [Flavobacterium sp.]